MFPSYFAHISNAFDPDLAGNKGYNLYLLDRFGFQIPNTYYIKSSAYLDFIIQHHIDTHIIWIFKNQRLSLEQRSFEIASLISRYPLPTQITKELNEELLSKDANGNFAVRSSSNLEDLTSSSFAGLYESYLNIKGIDGLSNAIKRCWESLWSPRAIAYFTEREIDPHNAKMGVIIQQMVPADYSGVIFTANPIEWAVGEMLLEYSDGLADRLLSGEVLPHGCGIDRKTKTVRLRRGLPKGSLPDEQILALGEVALEIEKRFGVPQDVEWAISGDNLYFLQTRPITMAARLPKNFDDIWTRANIAEVLPNVVTPLTWSIFKTTLLHESTFSTQEGVESDTEKTFESGIRRIQGRIYIRLRDFLNSFCYLPFVTPRVLEQVLGVDLPAEVQHYAPPWDMPVRLSQGLFLLNALGFGDRLARMAKFMPPLPSSHNMDDLLIWTSHCFHVHLKCTAYSIGAFALLAKCLRGWLPHRAEELLPTLLVGRENLQTAAQGFSLQDIAERVRSYPALHRRLLQDVSLPRDSREILTLAGGLEFLELFDRFLESNGARAVEEFELAIPRWSEDSGFLLGVLKKLLETEEAVHHHGRKKLTMDRRAIIAQVNAELNPYRQWIFGRVLAAYSDFCTLRENMKYRLMEGYGRLRGYFLGSAEGLVRKGLILEEGDIFFLTLGEVRSLVNSREHSRDLRADIMARRKRHDMWISQEVPPLLVGGDHGPTDCAEDELSGIGCSAGIVEGRARVLKDVSQAHLLSPGEILVAKHTDPGWTLLFLVAKGLVTEVGGFLSHGATVAREYGLPAVVNVTGATSRIRTGDMIRVDGGRGLVIILTSIIRNTVTTQTA